MTMAQYSENMNSWYEGIPTGTVFLSTKDSYWRVTETGDYRITEDVNFLVLENSPNEQL